MDIRVSDVTLRKTASLSFNEKTEIVKLLDSIGTDVIEMPKITQDKADELFLHTVSNLVKNSVISCEADLADEAIVKTAEAIKGAKYSRLVLSIPVSPVQMEYVCGKKPAKVIEMIDALTKKAISVCADVEVSFVDATRAEKEFLENAIKTAADAGATVINICDDAGTMLPGEFGEFVKNIASLPAFEKVTLSVEANNGLYMAAANTVAAAKAGASQIKAAVSADDSLPLKQIAEVLKQKKADLGIDLSVDMTKLENAAKKIEKMTAPVTNTASPFDAGTGAVVVEDTELDKDSDITKVSDAAKTLGYTLSDDDLLSVYEEFKKTAANKTVTIKELDAIISSAAMQVPPTYKVKSYVINSGNIITPTANIEIYKKDKLLRGISIGDGPIDAAFLAIEQIAGHHYELDDFEIKAVTGGYEAMGFALVKLRHNGKLFSGSGISTDIVGASIEAYVNALNKICFEEGIA